MNNATPTPMQTVRAVNKLRKRAKAIGVDVACSYDFDRLAEVRRECRPVHPAVSNFFDTRYNVLGPENAIWVSATNSEGRVVYLHAFRLDEIPPDREFSEWVKHWMLGIRGQAGVALKLTHPELPRLQALSALKGRVVYQGELWIDEHAPAKFTAAALKILPVMSMMLAYVNFRPNAIWALVDERGATKGGVLRAGNPYVVSDFFVWEDGALPADTWIEREWISTVVKDELERLILSAAA